MPIFKCILCCVKTSSGSYYYVKHVVYSYNIRDLSNKVSFKKKIGMVAHFREQIFKNHMRQNLGKEKPNLFRDFLQKSSTNFIHLKFPRCITGYSLQSAPY
jgi:hypothetical protein